MLLNVHVKNLALIEEVEVYFKEGLNILSGETGVGKSIIIGSINLALGSKIPKDIIRKGADYGLVELVFDFALDSDKNLCHEIVSEKINELDIPFDEGQVIISRKIMDGKSIIKVNGQTVSATMLRSITSLMLDVHGQHDHESLLNKSKHMDILDEYASDEIDELKRQVSDLCKEYKKCYQRLEELDIDEDEKEKEIAFLKFQINEIEEAGLKVGEDEKLEEEFKKMNSSKKIIESLNTVYEAIGEESSFGDNIGRATREMSSISSFDERLESFYSSLTDIESICSDLSREVSDYIEEMTFDEERISYVSERLNIINKLKLKYGNTIKEILDIKYKDLVSKYELIINSKKEIEKVKSELEDITNKLNSVCDKLTKVRKKAALLLEKSIVEALSELNFEEVKFKVDFKKSENFNSKGNDVVEFYISTNHGEEIKPLSDVASGGELSRIMLALKTIMAGKDGIGTLIFDEIDTGISGRTAQKVSEKLKVISKSQQVIAITHLPQIASMADNHYLIEKLVKNDVTVTQIKELAYDESVEELARLLGGSKITDAVLSNAREMKELAKQAK